MYVIVNATPEMWNDPTKFFLGHGLFVYKH